MAEIRAAEVTRPFTAPPLRSHIVMTTGTQSLCGDQEDQGRAHSSAGQWAPNLNSCKGPGWIRRLQNTCGPLSVLSECKPSTEDRLMILEVAGEEPPVLTDSCTEHLRHTTPSPGNIGASPPLGKCPRFLRGGWYQWKGAGEVQNAKV